MARSIPLLQLLKYDTTQKILVALADAESRSILLSTIKEEKSAAELSETLHIPLSSVYKKLSILVDLALMKVTRIDVEPRGRKKFKLYKSRISKAEIRIEGSTPAPILELDPN